MPHHKKYISYERASMLLKRYLRTLFSFLLLTAYSAKENETCILSSGKTIPRIAAIVAVLTGVPLAAYWYQNYFIIDRMPLEILLDQCKNTLQDAQALVVKISHVDKNAIHDIFLTTSFPYITYCSKLERTINHLIYYKRGLIRKYRQQKLEDKQMINTVSKCIKQLQELIEKIENNRNFKEEKIKESFFLN